MKLYRVNGITRWFAEDDIPEGAEPVGVKMAEHKNKAVEPINKAVEPQNKAVKRSRKK